MPTNLCGNHIEVEPDTDSKNEHGHSPGTAERVQKLEVAGPQRQRLHDADVEQHRGAQRVQCDVEVRHVGQPAALFASGVGHLGGLPGGVQRHGGVRIGGKGGAGANGGWHSERRSIAVGAVAQRASGCLCGVEKLPISDGNSQVEWSAENVQ